MLRSAGYTLPWIEQRQQITTELEEARAELRRGWSWRERAQAQNQPAQTIQMEWQRAVDRFRARAAEANKRIFNYNLQAPALNLHLLKVDIDEEIQKIAPLSPAGL
jgi:hypothetical protein